jgi:dolichol-phosphate mannosyltransferase
LRPDWPEGDGARPYPLPVTAVVPLVSVVVPTRNETANVRPLWERTRAALGDVSFEICFVDDSDDATPAVLAELAGETPQVRYTLRQGADRVGGLSTAVVAGLRMARGEFVCVMDGDLQHPPEVIPLLLAEAAKGADLVVASRYAAGGSRRGLGGGTRRLVSRGATLAARLLFNEARLSADPLSGFFLCRRSLIDGIEFRPVGFKILLELLVCVPSLRVVDVPLTQAERASGESKATLRQGLLYLGHLRSLVLDVPGSARLWKFGIVGLSGLGIFVPILFALSEPGGWNPLVAFLPAYALSAVWNSRLNWRWTFADMRRGKSGAARYQQWALVSGAVMFVIYAVLIAAGLVPWLAGLGAALLAMAFNGVANRAVVRRGPAAWGRVAVDQSVQAALSRLAQRVGADRAYVLPPDGETAAGLPPGLLAHVVTHRHPTLLTEAASHRAQRRSNIESASLLILPVVRDDRVAAVVVCERFAPGGFDTAALEAATAAVAGLVPALALA